MSFAQTKNTSQELTGPTPALPNENDCCSNSLNSRNAVPNSEENSDAYRAHDSASRRTPAAGPPKSSVQCHALTRPTSSAPAPAASVRLASLQRQRRPSPQLCRFHPCSTATHALGHAVRDKFLYAKIRADVVLQLHSFIIPKTDRLAVERGLSATAISKSRSYVLVATFIMTRACPFDERSFDCFTNHSRNDAVRRAGNGTSKKKCVPLFARGRTAATTSTHCMGLPRRRGIFMSYIGSSATNHSTTGPSPSYGSSNPVVFTAFVSDFSNRAPEDRAMGSTTAWHRTVDSQSTRPCFPDFGGQMDGFSRPRQSVTCWRESLGNPCRAYTTVTTASIKFSISRNTFGQDGVFADRRMSVSNTAARELATGNSASAPTQEFPVLHVLQPLLVPP